MIIEVINKKNSFKMEIILQLNVSQEWYKMGRVLYYNCVKVKLKFIYQYKERLVLFK